VNEVARAEVADLRDHHGEERVGGDVEGHAEEEVRAALIELATQLAILHKKLEQRVAGRERHEVEFRRIPGRDDQTAAVGTYLDVGDDAGDLIDDGAIESAPGPPLRAIDSPEVAVFIGPLVPDRDFVFTEIADVGVTLEEPQQLVDDRAEVEFFSGEQRKSFAQIKPFLSAKDRNRASAGAVGFWPTLFPDETEKAVVLLQGRPPYVPSYDRCWCIGTRQRGRCRG
jgi:hypothetical protein